MGRPHIEFIHAADVPERRVGDGPFAGGDLRVLSADDTSGALTGLVRLAPGWSGDLGGFDRRVELLVLRGHLVVGGADLPAAWYADVDAHVPRSALSASAPTLALVMVEGREEPGAGLGRVRVLDTDRCPLEAPGDDVPAGLAVKLLRLDARTGDRTWIGAGAPGYVEHRAEIHPTVEEAFVLRGDVLVGDRGEMGPGDYFWRPPNVRHGPIACRNGRLILFRTKGGDLSTSYEDVPGWDALVAAYRAREPFYAGPPAAA